MQNLNSSYPFQYKDDCSNLFTFGTGILILSTIQIQKPQTLFYKSSAGWDYFACKGVISFQLKLNNSKTVDFFVSHMQAGHRYFDQLARKSQSEELCEYFNLKNQSRKKNNTKWLIGDLNLFPVKTDDASGNIVAISPHANDEADARERADCYHYILKQTGLKDVHPTDGVYRVFSNYPDEIPVCYLPSDGFTDGPYLTLELPV